MTELVFIRHGKTAGNLRYNYVGRTDEALCEQGRQELLQKRAAGLYPPAELLFCSPMLRCRQTAELLYPELAPQIIDELREYDFGQCEAKNHQDLSGNAAYQEWLESGGSKPFPGGESRDDFAARCIAGLDKALPVILRAGAERTVFVVHGGTIMALLCACAGWDFYQAMCKNGEGYRCRLDVELWQSAHRLPEPTPLNIENNVNGEGDGDGLG